jgi:glycosyltransferase involved in cell wall biosynthesis
MEKKTEKAFLCVPFEQIGEALADLLGSPERQARLGAEAAAFAEIRFSPESCFSGILNFIQQGR